MQVAEIFEKASGKLPMIPKVVQELVNSFNRSDAINSDEIANTVGHDQILTARVLRLANSARYGGNRKVASLADALIILGFDNLRVLVIASGVTGATAHIPNFDLKSFWQRCFQIACTSKLLAQLAQQNQQVAFTCGLLARIGELVLHVALPESTPEIERRIAKGQQRMAVEQTLLGVDSAQVGAELAWRWSFPENIVQAIGQQCQLTGEEETQELAIRVNTARLIVHGFNHQQDETTIQALLSNDTLATIGLTPEQFSAAMPALKKSSTTIDDLF